MDMQEEKFWRKWPAQMVSERVVRIMGATDEIYEHLSTGSRCSIDDRYREDLLKLNREICLRADKMYSILNKLVYKELRKKGI